MGVEYGIGLAGRIWGVWKVWCWVLFFVLCGEYSPSIRRLSWVLNVWGFAFFVLACASVS